MDGAQRGDGVRVEGIARLEGGEGGSLRERDHLGRRLTFSCRNNCRIFPSFTWPSTSDDNLCSFVFRLLHTDNDQK